MDGKRRDLLPDWDFPKEKMYSVDEERRRYNIDMTPATAIMPGSSWERISDRCSTDAREVTTDRQLP
jgi:hypothetical protein